MANKKIAYIQFPGSNTENETKNILEKHGMVPFGHLWNDNHDILKNYDGYIILGGFSFEDRSRSGIIASLEPVVQELKKHALLGKPILGICNGAQILVESGLVPGNDRLGVLASLTDNKRVVGNRIVGTGYYNKWCYIKPNKNTRSAFIKKGGLPLRVPIAHAEGRFVLDKELEDEVIKNNLIAYKYCDVDGSTSDDFPINPNGSFLSAAALSNLAGNVMAIMPHPERTLNDEADDIFESMKEYMESDKPFSYQALRFESKKLQVKKFKKMQHTKEVLVSAIIADNEAASVEKCINNLGVKAKIKKYVHFEIALEDGLEIEDVLSTDTLFNPSKEYITELVKDENIHRFLVCNKDDVHGQSITQTLRDRFDLKGLESVKKSVLWEIKINSNSTKKDVDLILNSHIFSNPISQKCHEY